MTQRRATRARGSALITTLVTIVILIGAVGVLVAVTGNNLRVSGNVERESLVQFLGESGVNIALAEVNTGKDIMSAGAGAGVGYVDFGSDREGHVKIRLLDPTTGLPTARASAKPFPFAYELDVQADRVIAGRSLGTRRYKVYLVRDLPFPASKNAALAILGDPAKGKVEVKKPVGITGNGNDASPIPDAGVPGLGIQGDFIDTMKAKFDPNTFIGRENGIPVTGAQPIQDPPLDFSKIDTAAKAMSDAAFAQGNSLVPTSTPANLNKDKNNDGVTTYGGVGETTLINGNVHWDQTNIQGTGNLVITGDVHIDHSTINFGSDPNGVVFLNGDGGGKGNEVHIDHSTITGSGTLIVNGDVKLDHTVLNWNGPVIVLGGDDAKTRFTAEHSSLTIGTLTGPDASGNFTENGGLYLLGVGDKSAKFKIEGNDHDPANPSSLTLNGPLLAIADRGNQSKAEVKIESKQSDAVINGYVGVFGDKVKFKVKSGDDGKANDGSVTINGGVTLGVPDQDKKTKVEFKVKGDTTIQYNHAIEDASLATLVSFLAQGGTPPTYKIGAWIETGLK